MSLSDELENLKRAFFSFITKFPESMEMIREAADMFVKNLSIFIANRKELSDQQREQAVSLINRTTSIAGPLNKEQAIKMADALTFNINKIIQAMSANDTLDNRSTKRNKM